MNTCDQCDQENLDNFTMSKVHISTIKSNDTVLHGGVMLTVGINDLHYGFFGYTLFGDSYRAGTVPVCLLTNLRF